MPGPELVPQDSVVEVGRVRIGGGALAMIAGPCAVESAEILDGIAAQVKAAGANILRSGAFKPRTSPYRLLCTPAIADALRIQYGGSVKPDNAASLLSQPVAKWQ